MDDEAPKTGEPPAETTLSKHPWKKCQTNRIYALHATSSVNAALLGETCAPDAKSTVSASLARKKKVCFICRESLDGYDAAKDPRLGSETRQRAMCTLHQKKRGITNLISNGDGTYKCRDAQPCKVTGKGKGKEKGKERVKGKKKRY